MEILTRCKCKVIKQKGSSAKITVPNEIYEIMKLHHQQDLTATLTENGQLIIEKAKQED